MGFIKLFKRTVQCVFCLESLGNTTEAATNENKNKNEKNIEPKFSIREICHYFKSNLPHTILIIPSEHLENLAEETLRWDGSKNGTDCSVLLCQRCLTLAQQLTNLCRKLEAIQMRVDYSVKQLIDILSESSPSSDRKVFEEKETLQKSRQLRVPLLRCDFLLNAKVEVVQECFDDSLEEPVSPNPGWNTQEQSGDDRPRPQESPELETNKKTPSMCHLCSKSFPTPAKTVIHITVAHPHHFLAAAKLDVSSQLSFQALCWRLVQQQIQKASTDKKGSRKCPHCKATYKNRKDLKIHLVNVHSDKLKAKLTQMQLQQTEVTKQIIKQTRQLHTRTSSVATVSPVNDVNDDSVSPKVHPTVCSLLQQLHKRVSKNEHGKCAQICVLCPDPKTASTFLDSATLEKHIFEVHPDYFFLSFKKTVISLDVFNDFCSNAVHHFQSSHPLPHSNGQYLEFCSICSCTFLDKGFLVCHQIQTHFGLLCEKVMELQDQYVDNNGHHHPKLGRNSLYKNAKCPHCSMQFDSCFSLAGHLSSRHRGSSPPPGTKVIDTINPRQCKQCFRTFATAATLRRHQQHSCCPVIISEQQQLHKIPPGHKCPRCDRSFFQRYHLKRHLRQVHEGKCSPRMFKLIACKYCGIKIRDNNLQRHLKRSCQKTKQTNKTKKPVKNHRMSEAVVKQSSELERQDHCTYLENTSSCSSNMMETECSSASVENVGMDKFIRHDMPTKIEKSNYFEDVQYADHQSWELEEDQQFFEEHHQILTTPDQDPLM